MHKPNLATIEIKAFVPARDYARSMTFYKELGFTRASEFDGIAYFHCGDSSFLLQDFFAPGLAKHFQMHLLVENVDDWHARATFVAAQFNVRIGVPTDQPWGMRDFTLHDPSGVLWRIAQNIRGAQPVGTEAGA